MVRTVLAGHSIPWDLASLERCTRLHRRLVFLKARYALRIGLPPGYIRHQITHTVHKRDKGGASNATNYSRYARQKKKLKSMVERLVGDGKDYPEMATLLARWLIHLCEKGTSEESNLHASRCAKYYETLAHPLLRACPNARLSRLNDEALADAYGRAIDTVPPRHQAYTLGRLKEFHRFMMDAHGLPPVDWFEIAPVDCATAMSVDAGFVCWDEYLSVFRLLLRDTHADLRTRHLQAVVWFFIFRYGARVSEAFGLRRKDIVNPQGAPIVLFRNNDYREIKSDAGIRQVPLIGPLLAEERQVLMACMDISGSLPTTTPWRPSLPMPPGSAS